MSNVTKGEGLIFPSFWSINTQVDDKSSEEVESVAVDDKLARTGSAADKEKNEVVSEAEEKD